ncbi:MAG: site-specific integrase [Elusimicrobiota bacterium]
MLMQNRCQKRKVSGMYEKNGNWYLDYYVYGRRKREKIGTDKKLAETVLKKRRVEVAENKFLDIKKKLRTKLAEIIKTYLNEYSKNNKRSFFRDVVCAKHVIEYFGNKYVCDIGSLDVEKYKAFRKDVVKPATVNKELSFIKSIFSKAIEWKLADENPAAKVKKLFCDDRRIRFLSAEEIKKLLSVSEGYLRDIIVTAINTGMRRGEIFQLQWDNVDMVNKTIHIPSSLAKNKVSRKISMNSAMLKVLSNIKKHPTSPYVFCKSDGSPFRDVKKAFHTVMKKANIKDFRFHDLRHTFCSQLVLHGVDIYTVRELVGHKSIEMTMRYSHLAPDHKSQALETLSALTDAFWTLGKNSPEISGAKQEAFVVGKG